MIEGKIQERAPHRTIETTSEERTWAALAHASTLLTLLVGLPTGGLSGLLFVFVPLLIYLTYRDKSRFVAFHAAQAFVLQVVATVGFFTSIVAGIVIIFALGITSIVLLVILIGIVLLLVTVLVAAVIVLAWTAVPFAVGGFAIIGAIETGSGRDYHYPYIGVMIEDWLKDHESKPAPAV